MSRVMKYTRETWIDISYSIPASGQMTFVDGPVDWILGIWKTPFQAVVDLAMLVLAKFDRNKSLNVSFPK